MMERATGSNYERLMQRFVFDPLGMSSATFDPPVSNPNNPRQPIGHLSDGTPTPRDRPPTEFPTGALRPAGADLRMNVTDWSKFIRVHLGQAVGCHPQQTLPAPQTLARLHQAVPVSELGPSIGYAAGWLVASAEAVGLDPAMGTVLYHNGSDGVWYSEVLAFPRLGMSIQILANTAVDSYGNPLESTAFAEIKQRILARFMK